MGPPGAGSLAGGGLPGPKTPADASDDRQLAAAICGGDEAAFERFVEAHHARVARLAGRFFGSRPDVEEVVQDVFVKSWFGMGTYRGETPLEHWLSRITVNACYDRLRARRRHREDPVSQMGAEHAFRLENRPGPPEDNPEARQRRREEAEAARALLERLSAAERLVLTLMVLEERTVREIAALTGWSSANVKIRAFRARRKMRKLVLPETLKR